MAAKTKEIEMISWTTKTGLAVEVEVIDRMVCRVTLDGKFFAQEELIQISSKGPVIGAIGKLGLTRENYDKVLDAALAKIEAEKTPEQKARDAESKDYDDHCRLMDRVMSI